MKKGDKIAAILIIIIIAISFVGVKIYKQYMKSDKHIAVIEQNGKIIKIIDLDRVQSSKQWTVYTEDGHYNTIRVEPHKICIIEADCPNLECVRTGWISEAGDITVCLPHKILIKIEGNSKDIDGVAY